MNDITVPSHSSYSCVTVYNLFCEVAPESSTIIRAWHNRYGSMSTSKSQNDVTVCMIYFKLYFVPVAIVSSVSCGRMGDQFHDEGLTHV